MTAKLITTCAVIHVATGDVDEDGRMCVGHCPACHQAVYDDQDPVWTCPTNLNEGNPHHVELDEPISKDAQRREGIYSNCGRDFGYSCFEDMPLHDECYGSDKLTY